MEKTIPLDNDVSLCFKESKSKAIQFLTTKEGLYLLESNTNLLILFINPISGSQEGKIIQEVVINNKDKEIDNYLIVHFPYKDDSHNISLNKDEKHFNGKKVFSVVLFNILNKVEYHEGIGFISAFLESTKKQLKILIGGGDGTVLRLVEYLNSFLIDLTRCYFGHIPLGTGNDLSNAMGFGSMIALIIIIDVVKLNNKLSQLHRVLSTYVKAKKCKIDIWRIILYMKEEGSINEIQNDTETPIFESEGKLQKTMIKTFINYFSIGFDARIGFNFEQRRSANRTCNKMIYCWEATKRYLCCKKNITLPSILEAFHSIDDKNGDNNSKDANQYLFHPGEIELSMDTNSKHNRLISLDSNIDDLMDEYNSIRRHTIFRTFHHNAKEYDKVTLRGNPVDIICQNINFYMGGTMDIWENSSNVGLKIVSSNNNYLSYSERIKSEFNHQHYDDKKLEFFTYDTGISMALERVASGQADKIYQGRGPLIITFKQNPNNDEYIALNKVYYNVDGEFFHLLQPKELHIELNDDICDGQINFLKNDN